MAYDPHGHFESLATGETTTDMFAYNISDGDGGTATGFISVVITGQNDLPTISGSISDHTEAVREPPDGRVTIDGSFTDVDLSDSHTVTVNPG